MSQPQDPLPGEGWAIGPDGMARRSAARVLLFDGLGRLLLVNAHDAQNPARHWWFTVGGGIDEGESARDAAVREVREETGLEVDPASLIGPVAVRSSVFDFFARHVRQDEEYFVARLGGMAEHLVTTGWTAVERSFMDGLRWFTRQEIEALEVEVFPVELVQLLDNLVGGWDGTLRRLGDLSGS
ncbi:8-oxo-dGTP pyrophosphatase MutT, NUDIX family [Tessaracoccus bendigoensis DSM 12906]|uniref:8-oxo-dGTP pyrophosphatase MutT, NUDIX family n=1 Tax=Tessaracoccus bendigoensis DSM 12906 TaxID=1123357 RepID=A0A1M6HPW6_9ACTN|nr:NUDIX domain-containing protein [Tessaracoccus bendigoensis]SHJ24227.1 8-oxo-dGTP pyrophosphatase MutT, NUDIX family [Tessaracoccus bendigoensis DSM 12906]